MALLFDLVGFAAKGVIIVVAILLVAGSIASLVRRGRTDEPRVRVRRLNARFRDLANAVRAPVLGPKRWKRYAKTEQKTRRDEKQDKPRVFVLDFHGDIAATAVASLREEITAVLGVAGKDDEVVLRLESPGGMVHAYGFAASQVARVKQHGVRLTVCVDKIAASGGYMMACLGDKLVCAPFAIIGSIGVVAAVPNVHNLLEKHGVEFDEMTAGEFKRTVSFMGKISPEGRKKFQDQLEETHVLFKDFVRSHRPGLDIQRVATGEYWFGQKARELSLVDELLTSDDYLLRRAKDADVFHVTYKAPMAWRDRVAGSLSHAVSATLLRALTRLNEMRFS